MASNFLAVLRAISASKPRTHSYGFAQTYISDTCRLHLFSEAITIESAIPDQVPVRHDHRYDFTSWVLKGVVIDNPCHVVREHLVRMAGEPWIMHDVKPAHEAIRDKDHGAMWREGNVNNLGIRCYVVEGTPRIVHAGESYSMKAREFHATQYIGDTLTLFKRENVSDKRARLIVPPGYAGQHSIEHQPDEAWLKDQFLNAYSQLPAWAYAQIAHVAEL